MKRMLILGALLLAACGSADDSKDLFGQKVCTPGATTECACPGGAKGAQACLKDGTGYDTCQCGGGSGGSSGAGGGGQSGGGGATAGAGGAGGGCTPRSCPVPESDGGAPACGMIDNLCGGTLNCGCEYGECATSCTCWHNPDYDQPCAHFGAPPLAVQCTPGKRPTGRTCSALGATPVVVPPPGTFCCQ